MEKLLIFDSAKEVRFGKLLKFIIPTYLTALYIPLWMEFLCRPMWGQMHWRLSILCIRL